MNLFVKKKQFFSLTELIVVIVVLSVLASIVVIGTKNVKQDSYISSIQMNLKTIQTASDKYAMYHNGKYPIAGKIDPFTPQEIKFEILYPDDLRSKPKSDGVRYWLDYNGKVWGSTSKLPSNIEYTKTEFKWSGSPDAEKYRIYAMSKDMFVTGSANQKGVTYVQVTELTKEKTFIARESNKIYLVSSVDKYGFETAPVGVNPTSEILYPDNHKPIAIMNLNPADSITTSTHLIWDSKGSYDPDGDLIVKEEWEGKENIYSKEGEYTVRLRVQDDKGFWSDWLEKTISVTKANQKPTAVISMTPETDLTEKTIISWSSIGSSDPDKHKILQEEWKNKLESYGVGEHTVQLRVQDEKGVWSDWVSKTFVVNQSNRPPQAMITLSPNDNLTTDSVIAWSAASSIDIDGDKIIQEEWKNKATTYNEGAHIVELRVQDEHGLWSDWVSKVIAVSQPNVKPIAVISSNPNPANVRVDEYDAISWNSLSAYDPNGDNIVSEEWKLNGETVEKLPPILSSNDYKAELRVQDEHGLWSDWTVFNFTIALNNKPVAVIETNPTLVAGEIYPDTEITFSSDKSYDVDVDTIKSSLWVYNGQEYTDSSELPKTFAIGSHTVTLTVTDEHGLASNSVSKSFNVVRRNNAPVPIISMSANNNLTNQTDILFDSNDSYDPDGDLITNEEWFLENSTQIVGREQLPKKWSIGTHTVGLRVADSEGKWSEWTSQTFAVTEYNTPPEAVISMTPEFDLTSTTAVTWVVDIADEDGDTLQNEEWINKKTYYPEGTHIVSVRVQDSRGLWGPYTNIEFQVVDSNSPPAASITMNPINPIVGDTISWSGSASSDPDGDKIVSEDWIDNPTSYSTPGEYSTYLRVQDEHGVWSEFTGKTYLVTSPPDPNNQKPVAIISADLDGLASDFPNRTTSIHTYNVVTWKYNDSTDPDGDKIIKAQWMGDNQQFSATGSYTVQLRVMDEHGVWSDWISKTFNVVNIKNNEKGTYDTNSPPTAVITMTPDPSSVTIPVTKKTKYDFDYSKSTDPNGDKIVKAEWINKKQKYGEGTHTVSLRVMDSKGAWSTWTSKTFSIGNKKPIAIIQMNPDTYIEAGEVVTWDDGLSYDPDGDVIVQKIWAGKTKNYPDGNTYRVKLRVKDSSGLKSDWACQKVVSGTGGSQVEKYSECDSTSNGSGYKLSAPKNAENKYYSKYFKNCPQEGKLTVPCGVVILSYESPNGNIYTDTKLNWTTFRTYDPTGSAIASKLFTLEDGSKVTDDVFAATHKTLSAGSHKFSYQVFRESEPVVSSEIVDIEVNVVDNEQTESKTDSSGNKYGHVLRSEKCVNPTGDPDIKNCNVITVRYNSLDGKIYTDTELHWTTEESYSTDGRGYPLSTNWFEGCPADEEECITLPEEIKVFPTAGMKKVYTVESWPDGSGGYQDIWNTLSFEVVDASQRDNGLQHKFEINSGKVHIFTSCSYQTNPDRPCAVLKVYASTDGNYTDTTKFTWDASSSYSPKGYSIKNVELFNAGGSDTLSTGLFPYSSLRVQDEVGVWSDQIQVSISTEPNIFPCYLSPEERDYICKK